MASRSRAVSGGAMIAAQVAAVVVVVVLWQVLSRSRALDPSFIGTPTGVWSTLREWAADGTILAQLSATMLLLLVGLAIGTVVGTLLGMLIGLSRFARDVIEPFLIFFNGMPRLVLQPFFIVWLGFGFVSRLALVFVVIVVLVVVGVANALDRIDRELVVNAQLMGASRLDVLRQVYVPWLGVDLIANARSNVGFAFQAALVAEFVGGASGLGYLIVRGQNTFDIDSIWAALVIVVAVSIVIDRLLVLMQGRASRWLPAPA